MLQLQNGKTNLFEIQITPNLNLHLCLDCQTFLCGTAADNHGRQNLHVAFHIADFSLSFGGEFYDQEDNVEKYYY
jgi:hypothetical protein